MKGIDKKATAKPEIAVLANSESRQAEKVPGAASFKINKVLLGQLVAHHKEVVEFFSQNDKTSDLFCFQRQKMVKLKEFIQNMQPLQKVIPSTLFEQVVVELRYILKNMCISIKENLPQNRRQQNEEISVLIKQKLKRQKKEMGVITTQFLIKIDILSVFLLENHKYCKILTNSSVQTLASVKFLSKIFEIDTGKITQIFKVYQKYRIYLKYQYQNQVKSLIALCHIVQVRSKISNNYSRYGSIKVDKILSEDKTDIKITIPSNQDNQADDKTYLKYSFSQIRFLDSQQNQKTKIKPNFQGFIAEGFKPLSKRTKLERLRQFLNISNKQNIQISLIIKWYYQFEEKQAKNKEDSQKQIILAVLKSFQWRFVRVQRGSLHKILEDQTKLTIPAIDLYNMSINSSYILMEIYRFAVKRLQLISNVFKNQEKVEHIFQNPLQFFVSKFVLCCNTKDDSKITIILITVNNKLFCSCIVENLITYRQYIEFLKMVFQRFQRTYSFNLNLYEINFDQEFIDSDDQNSFINYFKKQHNANIYIITTHHQLSMHFLLRDILVSFSHLEKEFLIKTAQQTIERVGGQSIRPLINQFRKFANVVQDNQFIEDKYLQKLREIYTNLDKETCIKKQPTFRQKGKIGSPQFDVELNFYLNDPFTVDQKSSTQSSDSTQAATNKEARVKLGLNIESSLKESILHFKIRNQHILSQDNTSEFIGMIIKGPSLRFQNMKNVLRQVVRNLLIYCVYFIDKMSLYQKMENYHQLALKVDGQIQYLNRVYEEEKIKIAEIVSENEMVKILSFLINIKQYPQAAKLMLQNKREDVRPEKNSDHLLQPIQRSLFL